MPFNEPNIKLGIVVVIGAALKVALSEWHGIPRALFMLGAGLFSAYVFTAPIVDLLSLEPDRYLVPVAAIAALTGESVMRWIITATPEKLINLWRGKK